MANITCQGGLPIGAIPEITSIDTIPKNIDVVMMANLDINYEPMASCCAPNKVQLLDGCYLWCKIPGGDYVTKTNQTQEKLKSGGDIYRNFTGCLDLNGLDRGSEHGGIGGNIPSLGGRVESTLSMVGLGVWVLILFGVLMR